MNEWQAMRERRLEKYRRLVRLHKYKGRPHQAMLYEMLIEAQEKSTKILTDDPDCEKKLEAKIQSLEEEHLMMRRTNAEVRKQGFGSGYPPHHLKNVRTEISRLQSRLKGIRERKNAYSGHRPVHSEDLASGISRIDL